MKITDLAIIIPVLNCLDYTRKMIPTIKTKYPYKLILINNGSTDGTEMYFEGLKRFNGANVFNFRKNRGVGPAWNFGIREALKLFDSRYFFIPNNDILLHPNTIDLLIEASEASSAVLTTAFNVSGIVNQAEDVLTMEEPKERQISEAPDFSCFMLKKKAIDRIGFFDEEFFPAYFEDNDYHYRLKLAGLKALKIHRALYFHYGSRTIKEGGEIQNKVSLSYIANQDYYIRKWGGKPGKEIYKIPFGGKKDGSI